jgi:hypothetical protein
MPTFDIQTDITGDQDVQVTITVDGIDVTKTGRIRLFANDSPDANSSGYIFNTPAFARIGCYSPISERFINLDPTAPITAFNGAAEKNVCLLNVGDNYANDGAAATGGIAIGQLYHTSGAVKIRLT